MATARKTWKRRASKSSGAVRQTLPVRSSTLNSVGDDC